MTLRQQIQNIIGSEEQTNQIIELTIQTINNLATLPNKKFCVRTANAIRTEISKTGNEVSSEPKTEKTFRRTFR